MAKRWTQEEIEYLKKEYSGKSNKELCEKMNRTLSQIEHKSVKLGLKKSKELLNKVYNAWTKEEIQILKNYK